MKQTAVEWYEKEVNSLIEKYEAKEISKRDFIIMKHNLFYPAKEMEKQQIIDATLYGFREDAESFDWKGDNFNAEQYYNETFKK